MSKDKAGEGKENHGLRFATDTVGQEQGGSKKCDGVTAAIRERECVQRPDIPPAFGGRPENPLPRDPQDLPDFIRREAEWLREWGDDSRARALEKIAGIIEWVQTAWDEEPLTLHQAAEERGLSYSTIEKRVARGELENLGVKGKPRVRRGDLWTKSGRGTPAGDHEEPDPVGDLLLKKMSA